MAPLFPDEPLPPLTLGLFEFVRRADELTEDEDTKLLIDLVLAGRSVEEDDDGNEEEHRVFINPRIGVDFPNVYTMLGDFDSVIGLTRLLPFSEAITWHLHAPFTETLTTSGHTVHVPLHKIPNFMCLKFGVRNQGRLFFPRQYNIKPSPKLEDDFLATVYNHAVLPALHACAPQLKVHWPNSYRHVKSLVRGSNGQFSALTKDIPEMYLSDFAEGLLERLDALGGGFAEAFFELEARGVKSASVHNPQVDDLREAALDSVLFPLDVSLIPAEELETRWFVDVALEIHAEDRVMQWLSTSHISLIRHVLPSISAQQAIALRYSDAFKQDLSGHLTSLAGFRVETGTKGRADHVSYLNVYTTDKSATYQKKKGIYRRRTGQDLFPKPMKTFLSDLDVVTTTFAECASHQGVMQNGAARIEARVALNHALNVLTDLPDDLVKESVLAVPSAVWWYFKFYRAGALYRVFKQVATYPPHARAWIPSLMLGAVSVYMFNAVMYRPSGKRIEEELSRLCAFWTHPHVNPYEEGYTDADFENVNLVPCTLDRGLYFLSGIVVDEASNILRMPAGRQLDREELVILYKKPSMQEIEKALGGRAFGLSLMSRAHKSRTNNKRPTVPVQAVRGQQELRDFRLAERGMVRILTTQMTGPDVENASDPEDEDNDTLDATFSKIWEQFPSDIVQSSPNFKHRTAPAYIKLSTAEREDVTHELFKSFELPFDAAYVRLCTEEEWTHLVFDKFFPPRGTTLSTRLQNFRQARYFSDFVREVNRLSPQDAVTVRNDLLGLVRDLTWLPHPYSDRMWQTKRRDGGRGWMVLPSGHSDVAVHIAVNVRKCPNPSAIVLRVIAPPEQGPAAPPPIPDYDDDDDAAWIELGQRLDEIRTTQGQPNAALGSGVHSLLTSIRSLGRSGAAGPAINRMRSPSAAGSSASRAGGSRPGPSHRREEEEESSSVEVGRGPAVELDVFSIGLTRYRSPFSPDRTPSPSLKFRSSSPDLVESALFHGLDDDEEVPPSSPINERPAKRSRRYSPARDPFATFDVYDA